MSMRLGLGIGPNPCSDAAIAAVSGPFAFYNQSFENSPYGFTFDLPAGGAAMTLIPYHIDAATLEIEYRPDLAVSQPSAVNRWTLSDSTIIFDQSGPTTGTSPRETFPHSLYAITRSGIAIAVSGPQQTKAVSARFSFPFLCRIDDTHFVRTYVDAPPLAGPFAHGTVVETFSVSGGVISLVHTDTLPITPIHPTFDPPSIAPPPYNVMGFNDFYPFHYSGSGTLYAYMLYQGDPFGPRRGIAAVPYSIGGWIGTIGSSTRVISSSAGVASVYAAKTGSSECVILRAAGGTRLPFYDDGTHMHEGAISQPSFVHIDHDSADPLPSDTMQGNYLASSFTPIGGSPEFCAIVEQSGLSLTRTLITPIFRCQDLVASLIGVNRIFGCRHGPNLGALVVNSFAAPDSIGTLFAYQW